MSDGVTMHRVGFRRDHAAKQRAIRLLWQLDGSAGRVMQPYLYAVLDAARDDRIYPGLQRLLPQEQLLGLSSARGATDRGSTAPYLACLGTADPVFDWIWEQGWGQGWGIFVWSLVSLEALRAHFRRLAAANGPSLRFYDPGLLTGFLPSCGSIQLRQIFGPIQCFTTEAPDGAALVSFRLRGETLVTSEEPLSVQAAEATS